MNGNGNPNNELSARAKRTLRRNSIRILLSIAIILIGLLMGQIPPVWKLAHQTNILISTPTSQKLVGPDQSGWVRYERISKHMIHALVTSEDAKFFEHPGFDIEAILDSLWLNIKSFEIKRGASTITQQLVRMVFLSREQTFHRKLREVMGAVLLENKISKAEILEWYLNLVDFGPGVQGIAEASQKYFNTEPHLLTISQSIHLSLVLPSPSIRSRYIKERRLTDFGKSRFMNIAERMYNRSWLTEEQFATLKYNGQFGSPIYAH